MASTRGHGGIGIVCAAFRVTLESSDNTYIEYPATGLLTVIETGPFGSINRATFEKATDNPTQFGAPVEVRNPTFRYADE